MGIFQSIKDSLFITKCITQVQHVLPDSYQLADQFCTSNSQYFLIFRDKGQSYDSAVNFACMFMLDNPARLIRINGNSESGTQSLIIASNYSLMFLARWPHSEYAPAFTAALAKFVEFTKNYPVAKDLEVIATRNQAV